MGTCCAKNDDLSRGGRVETTKIERGRLSTSDRRQTFAANMKNFKNLKYVENIEDFYTFGAVLGKGSFGSVNRATRKGANFDCAVKVIDKDSLNNNPMLPQLMMSELTVLKKCSHPNIMSVNELLEDDNNFYIVTELLEGGELFDRIIEEQQFDEQKAAYILKQVLLAINYMH